MLLVRGMLWLMVMMVRPFQGNPRALVLEWTALNGWWIAAHTGQQEYGAILTRGAEKLLGGRHLDNDEAAAVVKSIALDVVWLGRFESMIGRHINILRRPVAAFTRRWKRAGVEIMGELGHVGYWEVEQYERSCSEWETKRRDYQEGSKAMTRPGEQER